MYKKLSAEEQVAKMQHLINFGKVEESKGSAPIVEFKKKAANGKTYGIIRESTKYYIMEAPQKDTEVLAEDFSYIGGFNNRKENEYSSYSKASNALDLKIMSINETVAKKDRVAIETPKVTAEWEDRLTEGMRKEIDRFKSITSNVEYILKEDKHGGVPSEHTLPEAPATHPSDKKVNTPFTDTAVAKGDKDFKETETNYKKAGAPFNTDGEVTSKDMQSDKTPGDGADDGVYCERPKYVATGVAGEHPKGGKVVRVNENNGHKIRIRLTEEQVLAWNDNKNFIDKSSDTHIGSSEPFIEEVGEESNQTEAPTEKIHESDGVVMHTAENQDTPTPGTSEVGDGQPFDEKVNEEVVTSDDAAGLPNDEEDFSDYPFPEVEADDYGTRFDKEYAEFEKNNGDVDDADFDFDGEFGDDKVPNDGMGMKGLENWQDDWNKVDDFEQFGESRERVFEVKLDDFGKHPAYRKAPMTLPPNKEVAINGAKEWDDKSAQGDEPFGKQIGDSAPFTELVDSITESLMIQLYGDKKKV